MTDSPKDTSVSPSAPSRRSVLRAAGATLAGLALGAPACDLLSPAAPTPPVLRPWLRLPAPVPAERGRVLVAGVPSGLAPDALGFGLEVAGLAETGGLQLEARAGGEVHVVLRNALEEPTTLHSHGAVVPAEMDGHPADTVAPGGSREYRYPVRQRAALLWVHPHPHGRVARQVYGGLAAPLVVRDEVEGALGLPSGDHELVLAVRDATFGADGRLRFQSRRGGFLGDVPVINGVPWPRHAVNPDLYRLRLLNASNARVFRLALSTGAPLVVVGNDGGLLPDAPSSTAEVEFGPAERLDVLLDLRRARPGDVVALRCGREQWDLLAFEVGEAEGLSGQAEVPTSLPPVPPLVHRGGVDRTFRFQAHLAINGEVYRMGDLRARVPFGRVERWRFVAQAGGAHPVHVHGASFQVVHRESRDPARRTVLPHERGWKDTVLLLDNEVAEVLVRFDAYRGRYLLHCHKLAHEDHGMMLDFMVE